MERLIKKYPNRKMYDTQTKKHITLNQIAGLIAKGHKVQVVDSKTKKDLTSITLAQIVLELQKGKGGLKNVSLLLNELIRKKRSSILEFIQNSILSSTESISLTKNRAQKIASDLVKEKKLDKREKEVFLESLLSKVKKNKQTLQKQIEKRVKEVMSKMDLPTRKELLELKNRLAELDSKLALLTKGNA